MMRQHEHFQYREDQILNSQVVRMQYASKDPKHSLSMVVWVPQERTGYHQLEQSLTPDVLTQSLAAIYSAPSYKVNLSLPRWKVEFSKSLKPALINNGMQTLFDDTRANLRGMYEPTSPSENLYVTDVLHKTFIEVQEGGTEAAGATAVIIATRSSSNPSNIKTVVADHAFLYAIVDDATQAVLFLGRLVNPSPY